MTKNKGVTLIENIIAVLLLGIIIFVTLFSFVLAKMYDATCRHHYQAINFARSEMEMIIGNQGCSPGDVTIDTYNTIDTTDDLIGDKRVYYNAAEASSGTSPQDGDMVTVTVSWTEERLTGTADQNETIVLFWP